MTSGGPPPPFTGPSVTATDVTGGGCVCSSGISVVGAAIVVSASIGTVGGATSAVVDGSPSFAVVDGWTSV